MSIAPTQTPVLPVAARVPSVQSSPLQLRAPRRCARALVSLFATVTPQATAEGCPSGRGYAAGEVRRKLPGGAKRIGTRPRYHRAEAGARVTAPG